jgi:murein DD-endopeptidase MepM/ murein hydrolase activator NlpD
MKKNFKILIVGLIIVITLTYTNISIATSKTDLQNQKSDLNESISQAQENLNDIKEEKSDTLNQVETLMGQISDYQSDIDDLDSQISDLQTKIKNAESEIKNDEEEYKKKQSALDERLVTMYENGDISYLDVLLSASSLTDFISSYYIVSELTTYDTEMIKQVEEEKQKIENEKSELETSKTSLDDAKKTKEAKASALKVAKQEKEEKASQLSSEEKSTQKEIEEMLEDKSIIDKQLQELARKEAERIAKEEAAKKNNSSSGKNNSSNGSSNSGSNGSSATPSSAGYIFPVQGCSKSNIRKLVYPSYAGHTGVDVNIGVTGKSVVAVKGGTVVTSTALKNSDGSYRSYGEYVMINHGDGTVTLYAHMLAGSRRVSAGDKVSQGQVIGTVGSTGNSTGTHLHFEVRTLANNFKPVNPIPYLP